jgi:ribonuclease BN (tRNA processing enzyme)
MSRLTIITSKVQQLITQHEALSVLLELGATRILLNCGYGVLQSLLEIGIHHSDIDHIILPHFRPEYIADLLPFLHAGAQAKGNPRKNDLHIYGKAEIWRPMSTFVDIFALRNQPSYRIVFHELIDADALLDIQKIDHFSIYMSKNQFVHLSCGEKFYTIMENIPSETTEPSLLKNAELVVISTNTIEEEALISFAASTSIKHIIYVSAYNESNPHALQRMAEKRGYQGTIRLGHNLMSFVL